MHAVSDPIPHVFGGTLLDIRSVVGEDRPARTSPSTRPTATRSAFAGTLRGGGADPADPAAFSSFAGLARPSRPAAASALGFGPKLFTAGSSARTKRARKNPKLRAVLVARAGDANISRAAVTLPQSLFLDQAPSATICTRVQFAAQRLPGATRSTASPKRTTPLLDGPLQGPGLPALVQQPELPDLRRRPARPGRRRARRRTDSVNGRIRRHVFDAVPDVPVSKFVLTIRGGKKRACWSTRANLCAPQAVRRPELRRPRTARS